uniref:Uncharacterized protein n=1 Tax=Guillardia theta TaxID=55529 RepID=A0A7S4PR28_GUITH|mmetsp:Transcript_8664/g.28891  ORF Transcript_8664/g.28891 Transcript_8664/m.28891 type:complete len:372 (+) Transcript_8664:146-1261(+)
MDHSPIVPATSAEVYSALLSAPSVSKFFAGLTLLLYVLAQLVPSLESILAIKATNTYGAHSYIWNVFTAGFFNTNIVLAILLALTFLIMGRWLVPSWGSAEFVKYIFFSNLCVGLSVFISQIVYYMASFNYKFLEMPISGGIGIIAALIVTIKQKLPEEPIILFGQPFMNFCAKDIPGVLICFSAILSILELAPVFLQCCCGTYFGWLYLRFLQRTIDGMRGDMSDHMAFIMFFPVALRPLMQVVSSSAFKMVCGKSVQSMLDDIPARSSELRQALPPGVLRGAWDGAMAAGAPPVNVPAPPLPGSNVADAERRRARALKTLEDRMRSIMLDAEGTEEGSDSVSLPVQGGKGDDGDSHEGAHKEKGGVEST